MLYTEKFGLQDCSGFVQIESHINLFNYLWVWILQVDFGLQTGFCVEEEIVMKKKYLQGTSSPPCGVKNSVLLQFAIIHLILISTSLTKYACCPLVYGQLSWFSVHPAVLFTIATQ